jgi:Xaa-Pro aminopeptidase
VSSAVDLEPPLSPEDAPYPRFSHAEYGRRHDRVDALRAEAGVQALVIYGSGNARHDLQYLTAWPARQEGWLVLGPAGPPALFVQLYNHVPNAREMAVVERVEWGGTNSATTVARELQARHAARVGLVGAIPYQAHARLAAALPGVELVDLTAAFRRMRLVKSEAEIAWTRRGAGLCDVALRALVASARPGMREYELGALVEGAYGRLGGQHGICFLATAPMTGGGRFVPAQNWSSRRVEEGDAILIELSAGVGGYTGQVLRTIALGDVPQPYADLHRVAEEAFEAIVAAIRPGVTAARLLEVAGLIDRAGLSVCDDVVHGYGGGYLAPVLRTPATSHTDPPDLELLPGMMVVVQPNVINREASMGVQTGELVLVTEGGARSLHDAPRGLLRAGQAA